MTDISIPKKITYTQNGKTHTIMLIEEIGRGGSGVVWKALVGTSIKAVKFQSMMDSLVLDGLLTEFFISMNQPRSSTSYFVCIQYLILDPKYKSIKFRPEYMPYICTDSSLTDGLFVSVYDLENGFSLKKLINMTSSKSSIPFSKRTIRDYCLDLLYGLEKLHSLNVSHRDIKPGNIILSNGVLKYIDFGASCRIGTCTKFFGTPFYMSPKCIRAFREGKLKTLEGSDWLVNDIFSLGVTFFQIICKKTPYECIKPIFEKEQSPEEMKKLLYDFIGTKSSEKMDEFFVAVSHHFLSLWNCPEYIPVISGMLVSSSITISMAIDMIYNLYSLDELDIS